jgi:hypothetical protein
MNVEDAVPTADEFGINAELVLDGRGQTGRARKVVSGYAPGDRDVHFVGSSFDPTWI